MLITVGKFCQKVSTDLTRFVDELQEKTGRPFLIPDMRGMHLRDL